MVDTTAQTNVDQGSVLRRLIDIGIALSAKKDHNRLMLRTLVEVQAIYNADGGSFYLLEDDRLPFAIVLNDSMGIAMGGTTDEEVPFPPLALHDPETKEPYKKAMTLSQSLRIMRKMSDESHIDPNLSRLFVEASVYRRYADEHLRPEQINEVPLNEILGHAA